LHIHQFAKCEAPDFKSAGPHFNPVRTEHPTPQSSLPTFRSALTIIPYSATAAPPW
jgi:hypothetical protein